ncbi:MAG: hypothetical protein J6C82_04105 [Clostridia bacterium]|nr:hypothetical protein [Clostridia bacterium]
MEYLSKVCLNHRARREYMIKISLVGSVSLLGVILAVYSIFIGNYLFAAWYFAAFILGLSYVIIRINTVFPTYLAADAERVVLSVWKNGVLPYTLPEKPTLISDFIPERVKIVEIAMGDIDTVLIGSRKYLLRNLTDEEYPKILKQLDKNKHFDGILKRMDFIYIKAKDGENCFMSITGFDINGISEFVGIIEKYCHGVQIMTNLPKLVKLRNSIM